VVLAALRVLRVFKEHKVCQSKVFKVYRERRVYKGHRVFKARRV
jgi:hypothetical protein